MASLLVSSRALPAVSSRLFISRACLLPVAARLASTTAATNADSPYNKPFFEKNKALGRPLSPHLTIYQPQLTSVLSVTHRISGAGLATLISAIAITTMATPHDFAFYVDWIKALDLHPVIPLTAKFVVAWPAVFHTLNGIRHMVWDTGRALRLSQTYIGGYIVLGLSVLTTSLLTML